MYLKKFPADECIKNTQLVFYTDRQTDILKAIVVDQEISQNDVNFYCYGKLWPKLVQSLSSNQT